MLGVNLRVGEKVAELTRGNEEVAQQWSHDKATCYHWQKTVKNSSIL